MLNISKSYAKVWETEDKGKYVSGKIGTSRKNKETDEYINSSWFCRFVGQATGLAKTLTKGDKIIITNASSENVWDKVKQTAFTSVAIFEFELADQSPRQDFVATDDDNEDELPF